VEARCTWKESKRINTALQRGNASARSVPSERLDLHNLDDIRFRQSNVYTFYSLLQGAA